MLNDEIQTKEEVTKNNDMKLEQDDNVITLSNISAECTDILAKLSVPYDDINVLLEDTDELKLVDNFFDTVTCRR